MIINFMALLASTHKLAQTWNKNEVVLLHRNHFIMDFELTVLQKPVMKPVGHVLKSWNKVVIITY